MLNKSVKKKIKYNNKFIDDLRSESYVDDIYNQENSHHRQKFIQQLEEFEHNQQLEPIDEIRLQYPNFSLEPLIALIVDKKNIENKYREYIQIRLLERNGVIITMAVYQQNQFKFENIQIGKVYQFQNNLQIQKFHSSFILEHGTSTHYQETNIEIIDNKLELTIAELKRAEIKQKKSISLICLITLIDINKQQYNLVLLDQSDKYEMKINLEDFNYISIFLDQILLIQNFKINESGQVKFLKKTKIHILENQNIFIHQPKLKLLQDFKLFQQFYLDRIFKFKRAYFSEDILESIQQLKHNFISISRAYFEFKLIDMKKFYDYCQGCNNKDLSQCIHQNNSTIEYFLTVKAEQNEQSIIASMFSNIIICDFDLIDQMHPQGYYIVNIVKYEQNPQNYKYIITELVKLNQ